ncbi:MAG: hypothetical protein JWM11_7858, partial [Planctomycetaceae bacterium]|nr:hypothetical protein [Planctomycetaceae bacterium]
HLANDEAKRMILYRLIRSIRSGSHELRLCLGSVGALISLIAICIPPILLLVALVIVIAFVWDVIVFAFCRIVIDPIVLVARKRQQDIIRRRDLELASEQRIRDRELQRIRQENSLIEKNNQQRRMDARSKCELLYNMHEADIHERFNRQAFDRYLQKYMSDAEPPEVVESRGVELQAVIEKHCEVKGIADKPQSIDQLAQWFIDEKARIESLPLDERMRATHMAHLNMRYAELSQEILEKIRP